MSIKIKALKIEGTNNVLTRPGDQPNSTKFFINGDEFHWYGDKGMTFCLDDKITAKPDYRKVIGYKRGDVTMTPEEYRAKPQYYGDDSSDEDVLRVIANKKELAGFEPIHAEELCDIEFDVVGEILDTGSKFIDCHIGGIWAKHPVLYNFDRTGAVVDEYIKLSEKYKGEARFASPEKGCLEYVKINGNYAFARSGYGTRNIASYVHLLKAQSDEEEARAGVREIVKRHVFNEKFTPEKASRILGKVELARSTSDKRTKNGILDEIILDITKYLSSLD